MNALLKITGLILIAIYFSGCAPAGGGSGAAADAKVVSPALPNDPAIVDPALPTSSIALTYYSLARTEAPQSGWPTKTYTATGSCVVYLTKTYCWDDGIKTVVIPGVGSFYYNYWKMQGTESSYHTCYGGCTGDLLSLPLQIGIVLNANLPTANINQVFSSGISHNVTCSVSGNVLNCVDFSVDLTQTAF